VGAQDLRNWHAKVPPARPMPARRWRRLRTEQLWDVLGVRPQRSKAGKRIVLNWHFSRHQRELVLNLENSALTYVGGSQAAEPRQFHVTAAACSTKSSPS